MPLNDAQIERYSRQIIVPRIGGRGQERLLAAKMILAGAPHDIEQPLAYLVGAGVGSIHLRLTQERSHADLLEKMSALNPDATISVADDRESESSNRFDLAMLLINDNTSRDLAATLANRVTADAFIVARLDDPPTLAILTGASSCPRCADPALLARPASDASASLNRLERIETHVPLLARPACDASASLNRLEPVETHLPLRARPASDASSYASAAFVAMLASTEALKLLSGYVENPSSVIIDFDGCATRSRSVTSHCTCRVPDNSSPSS